MVNKVGDEHGDEHELGDADALSGLIAEYGPAAASVPDAATGLAPLHAAVFAQSVGCVQLLLAAGARFDAGDADGASPLQIAAAVGAEACVERRKRPD